MEQTAATAVAGVDLADHCGGAGHDDVAVFQGGLFSQLGEYFLRRVHHQIDTASLAQFVVDQKFQR